MTEFSRRELLRAGVTGSSIAVGGCLGTVLGNDEQDLPDPPGSPALGPSGEWPMPRFDAARTACNPDGAGLHSGAVYWMLDAGHAVTMANGTLYNLSPEERRGGTDLTWRSPRTAERQAGVRVTKRIPDHSPTVDGGRVYFADGWRVHSFDAASGERRWRTEKLDDANHPAVAGGDVFFTGRGGPDAKSFVQSRATSDGTVRWEEDLLGYPHSLPTLGPEQVFVDDGTGIQAFDRTTGEPQFSTTYRREVYTPPAVSDGGIYVDINPRPGATSLLKLDVDTGEREWETPIASPFVVGDDELYVRRTRRIVALDTSDGRETTTTTLDAAPVAASGPILYATQPGSRSLYALDRENGLETRWSVTIPEMPPDALDSKGFLSVTPVDGAVYVWNGSALVAIGPEEGLNGTARTQG
jgi:outer membrane protein assembly factor BamB